MEMQFKDYPYIIIYKLTKIFITILIMNFIQSFLIISIDSLLILNSFSSIFIKNLYWLSIFRNIF